MSKGAARGMNRAANAVFIANWALSKRQVS
jgi:hypothetical protein